MKGYDIRIETAGDKALAMIRFTRENDFRASGSEISPALVNTLQMTLFN